MNKTDKTPAKTSLAEDEKKAAKPREKKKSKFDIFKDILAVPLEAFSGVADDIFIRTLLPAIVRFVTTKNGWKEKAYWTGYKMGLKADAELDKLLKGRGELAEDPIQIFFDEIHDGWNDGCDKDEGKKPKYAVPQKEED